MNNAIIVRPDWSFQPFELDYRESKFLAQVRQRISADTLTCVRTKDHEVWLDDNGMYTQQDNTLLTFLLGELGYPAWQPFFGAGVITGPTKNYGYPTPLSSEDISTLGALLTKLADLD